MSLHAFPVMWDKKAPRIVRVVLRVCFTAFIIGAIVIALHSSLIAIERTRPGHANPARSPRVHTVPSPSRDR